jgi:chloramphenicol O-acetyltransferase
MNGTLFFLLLFLSISYVFLILFVYNECRCQKNQNVRDRFYVSAIGKWDRHDRFFGMMRNETEILAIFQPSLVVSSARNIDIPLHESSARKE